jgi:division protein CdvB (Snf7/Vps24/ESCRT-III family)
MRPPPRVRIRCRQKSLRPMNCSSKLDEYNKQVHGIEKKDYSELVERLVSLK